MFAVDLFNEGLDVPAIDTVLFLRPTESATVFLQQLGRGLRLSDDKSCLTVLDFIGHQHTKFRFDRRYRALTGASRRGIERQVRDGFPVLPAGCHMELDPVARDIVLRNVRNALHMSWRDMAAELRSLGPTSLRRFLDETMLDLDDLYGDKSKGWGSTSGSGGTPTASDLKRRLARLPADPSCRRSRAPRSDRTTARRGPVGCRIWCVESPATTPDDAALRPMGCGRPPAEMEAGYSDLLRSDARDELRELAEVLEDRLARVTHDGAIDAVPLRVHARYSRDEALAAFGVTNPNSVREGVKYIEGERADLLFVTLQKTEEHFSPSTMYRDRAITPSMFQWESQSTTTVGSNTGQRYINHDAHGSSVHLFIRETRRTSRDMAAPYLYAGQAHYEQHRNERPIEIIWRLDRELPADVYHASKAVAG